MTDFTINFANDLLILVDFIEEKLFGHKGFFLLRENLKLMTTKKKSSLTGPEIFVVVF